MRSKKQLASGQLPSILLTLTKLRECAVQNCSIIFLSLFTNLKMKLSWPVCDKSGVEFTEGYFALCITIFWISYSHIVDGRCSGCATPTLVFIWVKQGKDQTELWLPVGQESYHYVVTQRVHHCHRKSTLFHNLLQHLPPVLLFTLQLLH